MLQQLISGAEYTLGQYYSKGSRLNVLSHLRQVCVFCVAFNVSFVPISRDTLLGFIELMSRTSGYEHIEHILSSVRFIHNYKGHVYPGDSFEFKILLKGLKRRLARPTKQALPITPEILVLMYQYIDVSNSFELAHWCSFLFALRLLYRKSSIAPDCLSKFNPDTGLSREKAVFFG